MKDEKTDPKDVYSVILPPVESGDYIDCAKIQNALMAYIAGELGERASNLVREHLRTCPACKAEAASMMNAMKALRGADPAVGCNTKLSAKSMLKLMWLWEHPFWAWCYKWHRAVSAALAVVLIALLVFALYRWKWYEKPLPPSYPPMQILQELPPDSADAP